MLQIAAGVSDEVWAANGYAPPPHLQDEIALLDPDFFHSDEDVDADGVLNIGLRVNVLVQAQLPTNWKSGATERDVARTSGYWPDGKPVGRGHGQPYLQPKYAVLMAQGI